MFRIECAEYQTRTYKTRDAAERALAAIETGGACYYSHEIVEVSPPVEPRPRTSASS